uniref:Si:ch211-151h10.2 n=1 Tax=Poecilia formosa TaxID=48698 RepID=A0A096ME73_POEFO
PVAAVWFACQLEALPGPTLPQQDACCRLLLLCLLWAVLAGAIYALKGCLQPEPNRGIIYMMYLGALLIKKDCSPLSGPPPVCTPQVSVPLTRALTDSLLLCVLQEPLQDPAVSHIEALRSRLQAVAVTLEKVNFGPEAMLEEAGRGSALTDKLKLLCAYLQQRTASLQVLVQVQRDFESSVEDLLQGLDGLWTQLEELHAGVTLTKKDSLGSRDLTLVQEDAESLVSVLAQYRTKLQSCQAHLKGCTQLLQELTWSHAHINTKVNCGCESVWPELLLQSNIEQFDKVQENFSSLEQQTATFKTHLEGLGIDHQDEPV